MLGDFDLQRRRPKATTRPWEAQYPTAGSCVLVHVVVVELVELFELCICIGLSLGIDKLVLLKPQVKGLGEIVGHGRSPDPARVEALTR